VGAVLRAPHEPIKPHGLDYQEKLSRVPERGSRSNPVRLSRDVTCDLVQGRVETRGIRADQGQIDDGPD
jgi:hypothetical protein